MLTFLSGWVKNIYHENENSVKYQNSEGKVAFLHYQRLSATTSVGIHESLHHYKSICWSMVLFLYHRLEGVVSTFIFRWEQLSAEQLVAYTG